MSVTTKKRLGAALCVTALSAAISAQAGFQVSGTQLLDDNGNPFIMRGVNHPHTWFTNRTEQAFSDIASVGANTVRVVLSDGQQWSRNSASDVAQVIAWAKENELVAVLEVHDATGFGEEAQAGTIENVVDYWIDIAHVLEGEEDYVIINIANEPFGNNVPASTWVDEHVSAIQRLREAGLTHTLLVDAANWGQDWEGIMRDNASTVAAADSLNNTLFSVHMYEVYQDRNTVESYVSTFLDTHGLPLIVGEFGAEHYGNEVDAESVLAVAEQYDIGYLGWSWSGNNSEVDALDITRNWDVNNLSSWGDFLINSSNGLRETAETATVYSGENDSSSSASSAPVSSSSSSISSASSSSAPVSSSSSSSVSSAPVQGEQCNWYGTPYPLCKDTQSGWGWENSESCIGVSTCESQPEPYGVVGDSPSSSSDSSSSESSSEGNTSSSAVSSTPSSSPASSSSSSSTGGEGSESQCEFVISNEWSSGYTGAIRIHNESSQAIDGWSVDWELSDGASITNSWNARVSGDNPYSATDMGWNAAVQPGESVEIGFQVSKGEGPVQVPDLNGATCNQ
ncbi:cellulase family glycosylhydrolase [Marinimicrobium sp. C2-29]|uniref:cellulase family glycosylhydrolase n=1 Tax=Marinimicrobium sp. C2-29 TaxID=3139825 RepID=UPI0031387A37